jgi:hypothetical protein
MPAVAARVCARLLVLSRRRWGWLAVAGRIITTPRPVYLRTGAPRRLLIGISPDGLWVAIRGQAGRL